MNWGQVASGNFFTDSDMNPKDLEANESIDFIRKVLRTVLLQLCGMTTVSLLCSYFNAFKVLIGNSPVLYLSLIATIAFFVMMVWKEDLRKDAPMNHTYLLAGSISMITFYGSLSGWSGSASCVTFIMALNCGVAGLYLGSHLAKSSTNREYLVRKLITGAAAGFVACIILMVFAMSSFKFKSKESTFVITMLAYLLFVTYFGYVCVFVILPGHASHQDDYIWGVIRLYIHVGIVVFTLTLILFAICKRKCFGGSDEE